MSICYLNGKFLDLKEAKISPLDRGFLFGDAIYEVIASYNNKPFKIEEHLDRLFINLKNINPWGKNKPLLILSCLLYTSPSPRDS